METEIGSTPSHEVDSNVVESSSRVREKVDLACEHFSLEGMRRNRILLHVCIVGKHIKVRVLIG